MGPGSLWGMASLWIHDIWAVITGWGKKVGGYITEKLGGDTSVGGTADRNWAVGGMQGEAPSTTAAAGRAAQIKAEYEKLGWAPHLIQGALGNISKKQVGHLIQNKNNSIMAQEEGCFKWMKTVSRVLG